MLACRAEMLDETTSGGRGGVGICEKRRYLVYKARRAAPSLQRIRPCTRRGRRRRRDPPGEREGAQLR